VLACAVCGKKPSKKRGDGEKGKSKRFHFLDRTEIIGAATREVQLKDLPATGNWPGRSLVLPEKGVALGSRV